MIVLNPEGMELLLQADIPGLPPSTNNIWRHRGRTTYKTPEAKEWQENATTILQLLNRRKKTYTGKVYVEVVCHTRRMGIIDADNRLKAAQDCLAKAGVIKDDNQAVGSMAWKIHAQTGEHTVIEVWKWRE